MKYYRKMISTKRLQSARKWTFYLNNSNWPRQDLILREWLLKPKNENENERIECEEIQSETLDL